MATGAITHRLRSVPEAAVALRSVVGYVWRHPGNRHRRLHGLDRLVLWQVWQRVVRRPWTVQLRDGARLACYPHNSATSAVVYCGLPDWPEMNFLLDHLRPGGLFVDVGANTGTYAVLAASVNDVRVIALEPSAEAWARLRRNVDMNGFHSVAAVHAAAAAQAGKVTLTRGQDTINRVVSAEYEGETEDVEAVTVDEVIARFGDGRPLSLMKVDVEGGDGAVLEGASAVLARDKPALILENNRPEELAGLLAPLGYAFFTYEPATRSLVPVDISRTHLPNVIAIAGQGGVVEGSGGQSVRRKK
jgi:FkbM family methyltransferase